MKKQFITCDDELAGAGVGLGKGCADYCAAQVFLDGIAHRACAEARVEAALEEEGDDGFHLR